MYQPPKLPLYETKIHTFEKALEFYLSILNFIKADLFEGSIF